MNLDVLCKLMHTVCVGVYVRACACLGSIPHRLCLTGCPCRVNKTNLRSGLALGRGCWGYWGCLQEWRAYQEWRTHTYAHTLILKHLLLLPTLSFHYYTSGAPDVDKQSTCTLGRPPRISTWLFQREQSPFSELCCAVPNVDEGRPASEDANMFTLRHWWANMTDGRSMAAWQYLMCQQFYFNKVYLKMQPYWHVKAVWQPSLMQ